MGHLASGPVAMCKDTFRQAGLQRNQRAAKGGGFGAPRFLSVEDCRRSLPIRVSRRALVRYIKAIGPQYYQEHRRQIFLTPEQWKVVAASIKCSRSSGAGRRASFRSQVLSPERAFARARELLASDTPMPSG